MELKVVCNCGQKFAFDVEPVIALQDCHLGELGDYYPRESHHEQNTQPDDRRLSQRGHFDLNHAFAGRDNRWRRGRNDDGLLARGTIDSRADATGIALNLLPALRAGEFEFSHISAFLIGRDSDGLHLSRRR